MSDVVVTVPKDIWFDWIDEGDPAGAPESGEEWGFFMGGSPPRILPGERVYVVAHGLLRGYAPLVRLATTERGYALCRKGGAVAVTIPQAIPGFRGWRTPWWKREDEVPFPRWRIEGVVAKTRAEQETLALRIGHEEGKW